MRVHSFTFNTFAENTYVLIDDATRQCAVVDPGCYTPAEQATLRAFIVAEQLTPTALLLTHSHIDHVLGLDFVAHTWNLTPQHHALDQETLRAVPLYAAPYGFPNLRLPETTRLLPTDGPVTFGTITLDVRFAPGHAPGHVVFYHAPTAQVLGGDVLFRGSVGRTDLPGGDLATLEASIRAQLYTLPDAVTVYPGHGPTTTIGQEKRTNPFVRAIRETGKEA
ncbi:MAG: MBL fold metallo-hydrolase [Hymenobacteraceae bacterium]|nr:MBL fold metallo-hydrolase [Hymenobacteraceae bacterium]